MIIGIHGADGNILCQLDRIIKGFEFLGHTCSEWDDPRALFTFVANPPFDQFIELSNDKKFIFNILDLATHCKEHQDIVKVLRNQLPQASKVTSISYSVESELLEKCGVKSNVIYYPMKDVARTGVIKYPQFKALMAGRTSDPNKRSILAIKVLIHAGYNESELAIVGPEFPGWGARTGIVSDLVLNDLYNSVDYVFMTSKNEGIGLSAIEAACVGAIPIVMPDLSTYNEFWASSPMGPYYQTFTSIDKIANFIRYMDNNPYEKQIMKDAIFQYANIYFRPKFDKIEVAKRIINSYYSIV